MDRTSEYVFVVVEVFFQNHFIFRYLIVICLNDGHLLMSYFSLSINFDRPPPGLQGHFRKGAAGVYPTLSILAFFAVLTP